MNIAKINAVTVPKGAGEEFKRRSSANSSKVTDVPGFTGFQLLCPTARESHYFVFTEWESEEAYQGWCESRAPKTPHEGEEYKPVSSPAELLEFDMVLDVEAQIIRNAVLDWTLERRAVVCGAFPHTLISNVRAIYSSV